MKMSDIGFLKPHRRTDLKIQKPKPKTNPPKSQQQKECKNDKRQTDFLT